MLVSFVLGIVMLLYISNAAAGDDTCKGFTTTKNPYLCYTHGNCVWWAAYKRADLKSVMKRSAKFWYADATKAGFSVGSEPVAEAVAVFSLGDFGHVAYIEKVYSDGSFDVSEMDYTGSWGDGKLNATYHPVTGGYRRNGTSTIYSVTGFIYPFCTVSNTTCTMKRIGTIAWYPAISDCTQASQWFLVTQDANGEYVRIGSATAAACPAYCSQ